MADKSFGVKELNLLNASGTPTVTSPNNLNLNANTVAISTSATVGNNLTVTSTTNSANLNVTGIGTLTRGFATDLSVSGISTISQPSNANPHSLWDVVNNGSSAYRFTGPGQDGAEDNPNIYLVRGQRYIFKVNASGHPFQLRVANGGAAYSDGVTNNGAQSGNVVINVQHDAPAQLYYQCTSHGGMVGNIYIVGGPQVISGVVTATSFVGSGANITGVLKNIVEDTSPQLGGNLDCNNKNISLNDSTGGTNNRIKIGTNDDLQLWHNSSTGNSNISNYNGDLYLQGNNGSGTGVNAIRIQSNGAVELNYQGGQKFTTTNTGVQINGKLDFNGSGHLNGVNLGASQQLNLYHDTNDAYFDNNVGDFYVRNDGNSTSEKVRIQAKGGEQSIICSPNGAVELYHDNVKRFETDSNGVRVVAPEGEQAILRLIGDEGDDNNDYFRLNAGGGTLKIQDASNGSSWEDNIVINSGGSVELYHNNTKKLETTSVGVTMNDTVITNGEIRPANDNNHSIGRSNRRYITYFGVNSPVNTSDKNEKNTIIDSDLGLDFINKLNPVSYKWNKDDGKTHYGLIVQDLEETLTSIGKTVSDFGGIYKEPNSPMGLSYSELISPLIKAVQELSVENAALKSRLDAAGL